MTTGVSPWGNVPHPDEFHMGQMWKRPCRVATTANITISTALNAGDTIDGVTLAAGDRVLVKDQSTGSQNGIYVAGVTPIRDYDMDQDLAFADLPCEEVMGAIVYVIAGTANGGTLWRNTNTSAPTLGSTSLTFSQITIASLAASAVTVADSGGYFTGSDVEAVLQELGAKVLGYQAHGNLGSTETFSAVTAGWHSGTVNAACTFTFTAAASGILSSMVLELTQDGTGGWALTLPGSVVGDFTAYDTTAGTTSLLMFFSRDGGTTWYGFIAGGSGTAVAALDDLTDVTITSAAAGDRLRYDGSVWVNSPLAWVPLTNGDATTPELIFAGGDVVMTEVTP